MAKSKISEKIENKHTLSIEGILNVDGIAEDSIIMEVEEEGEVSLGKYLQKFANETVKITIVKKDEEIPE
ncbi:MAG: hypothetical protein RSA91_00965 [Bacilli bacterium]